MYRSLLVVLASVLLIHPAQGQDTRKIPISFLPPPLETATYSLGIYNVRSGQLVRRLQEGATQDAFTVGLNGLITSWDGKDDAGKLVPPGKYAARGCAVGALKVEGEEILGNDWAGDDENLRATHVEAIGLLPADNGLAVLLTLVDNTFALLRLSGDGKLLWRTPVGGLSQANRPWLDVEGDAELISVMPIKPASDGVILYSVGNFRVDDGAPSHLRVGVSSKDVPLPPDTAMGGFRPVAPADGKIPTTLADPNLSIRSGVGSSPLPRLERPVAATVSNDRMQVSGGKDGTRWTAAGLMGLTQTAKDGTVLRKLETKPGEPLPMAVSASKTEDRLYLLEEKSGWQRLRGLSWVETKQEDGKPVSTWQTFFERNIRPPDPALGLDEPGVPVEVSLVENPLDPGKAQKVKLQAKVDDTGSYLAAADGLRLRRISQRANLKTAKVIKGKSANSLTFFQNDGAAWDEFSIEGVKNIMAFDAGEIDMTADGEKTHPEKAAEPPDL